MSRATVQRAAIQRVLLDAAGPLLPEEILARAQRECTTLGQATVYRALKRLEESGDAARVVLGDGRPRYEASRPHHHHFHCGVCGQVFDIDGCVSAPQQLGEGLPKGFVLESHELVLHGRCADCAEERS